jgi:hypothetical protein
METLYGKNKKYLSYSAIDLWYRSKEQYRKRYYELQEKRDTAYTSFGKQIHSAIATDPSLSHIPRLAQFEAKLEVEIQGVKLKSFIDTFCPTLCRFFEYKTGIAKKDGEQRWKREDVAKHKQLPFYNMMIKGLYGFCHPDTLLIFLETEKKHEVMKIGNTELVINDELVLTGRFEAFTHTVTVNEVEEVRDWMLKASKEIAYDYELYLKR